MKSSKPLNPIVVALCATALLACSFNATAANITNTAGKVYSNVELVRREPDGITLRHDGGLSKVYFWDLPKEIREKFGYKPEKAQTFYRQSQERQHQQQMEHQRREQAAAKARKEAQKPEFPVWVHNIVPLKGRYVDRVRFDVEKNMTEDLLSLVDYKEIFIEVGETLKDQTTHISQTRDFINVQAGDKTKTYRVDWGKPF